MFKSNKGRDPIALKSNDNAVKDASENSGQQGKDGLADNVANLMIKLKFLTYKVFFSLKVVFWLEEFLVCCTLFLFSPIRHVFVSLTVENISGPQWPINSI